MGKIIKQIKMDKDPNRHECMGSVVSVGYDACRANPAKIVWISHGHRVYGLGRFCGGIRFFAVKPLTKKDREREKIINSTIFESGDEK